MTPTYTGVHNVIRVSHSLLITIPTDICKRMNIKKGDQVKVTIEPLNDLGIKYN
jgi:antitoxin component of MazEF toxin-antitoxin module